jgi:hypothetical protein
MDFLLIVLGVLVVAIVGFKVVEKARAKLCDAHVYKHLENGELLYCDEKQDTHKDYEYLGTAKVKCEKVNRCSLA